MESVEELQLRIDALQQRIDESEPVRDAEREEYRAQIRALNQKNQSFKAAVVRYLEQLFGTHERDGTKSLEKEDLGVSEITLLQRLEIEL